MRKKEDAEAVASIVAAVEAAIPSLEVRTASASRAGNKIQARLVWDEGGKRQLGYVSVGVGKSGVPQVAPRTLLDQALRLSARARAGAEAAGATGSDRWQRAAAIESEVRDALESLHPSVQGLCDEVHRKMKAVHRDGGHQANRRARNQKRAREALASTLDYVLSNGVSDDEVRTMLKEALVRHTMES